MRHYTYLLITISALLVLNNVLNARGINEDISATNGLFGDRVVLKNWLVAGPFPNDLSDKPLPDGNYDQGYYYDYLQNLGGEAKSVLTEGQSILFDNSRGEQETVTVRKAKVNKIGVLNFENIIGRLDYRAVYAFCYLELSREEKVTFLLGSDDAVKVWINGELVHQNYVARGVVFGEDRFTVTMHPGLNPILVKVTQGVREWGLVLEALTEKAFAEITREEQDWRDFDLFLNNSLIAVKTNRWNYFFNPGSFPELEWEDRYLVEKVMGRFPLSVRWFDSDLNEVITADKPGRYLYYTEGLAPNGVLVRRAGTMYCLPENWVAWGERLKAPLEYFPVFKNPQAWNMHKASIADYTGRIVLLSMLDQREGAILLSFLDAIDSGNLTPGLTTTPAIMDHDMHLALKRKILGMPEQSAALKMPERMVSIKAPVLRKGNESEAGFQPGTVKILGDICRQWYEASREPFQVLVARGGVVLMSESFSSPEKDRYDISTVSEVASITKLLTGLMFAQFVDQKLIGIDDPVGKYLPDFPTSGDKAITLRHCFTHTGGLWGHEEWGGMHNPWLDNAIANLLPRISVGIKHEYNGMGYNLAGKVMEMVSGKSIFRLMRENFFDPLGLENTIMEEDLAFSCHSNAEEFAVFGQLLLNRGAYGELKFFSPETFAELMPRPLAEFYPGVEQEWGIGITWMRQQHPSAGQSGYPQDLTILSKNVIGHGSATSAVLRVDLDNGLVICQTRRNGGAQYEKYLERFLMAIEEGLISKDNY